MLTERQYQDAISFNKDFYDALNCIEQNAEREASKAHYKSFSTALFSGLRNNQINLDANGVTKGADFKNWSLNKTKTYSQSLTKKYGFESASSREDLLKKFGSAIKDLQ
jgi:hypothetical protein